MNFGLKNPLIFSLILYIFIFVFEGVLAFLMGFKSLGVLGIYILLGIPSFIMGFLYAYRFRESFSYKFVLLVCLSLLFWNLLFSFLIFGKINLERWLTLISLKELAWWGWLGVITFVSLMLGNWLYFAIKKNK